MKVSNMKRAFLLLLTTAAPLIYAEDETTSVESTQNAASVYSCDNEKLETSLKELKIKSEGGDTNSTQKVYETYFQAGYAPQAEAWFNRLIQQKEKNLADTGDVQELKSLGVIYLQGAPFLAPNTEKAIDLLSRAAEQGDANSALKLGNYFATLNAEESRRFYEKAYTIYKQTVDSIQSDSELTDQQKEALTLLGDMELTGTGTQKNPQAGIAHLEQANTGSALLRLFQIYEKGIEVPVDLPKALLYVQQLVDHSMTDIPANISLDSLSFLLANYYLNGKDGIEKNIALGEKYLDKAEHNNYAPAIYYKGLKLKEENKDAEAFNCFIRLASYRGREPNSMMHAALMLMYGAEGVEQDEARALGMLEELANRFGQDNEWYSGKAPYELALYYDRIGEPAEADVWYRVAAERNVIEAMARKGLNHITPGNEEEWSPTLMYKWWKLGSDAGDPTCSLYLNIFLWGVIPLILIIVFGLPILIVHLLNKRAEKKENKHEEETQQTDN